jgi:hypothetical protein
MKCYYRIDDDPWIKGEVVSMAGGTQINFHSRTEDGRIAHEITLHSSPEVLFFGPYMSVTGFVSVKDQDNIYKLVSLDVSGGWVKPKD